MPLTLEQKIDAFEKWCQRDRRKNSPRWYTDDEMFRKAGQYRQMAVWGAEISQEELAPALRERLKEKSRKAIAERVQARQKAAAKKVAATNKQLKQEIDEPSFL